MIGSGAIGQAIARRVGVARKVLLADINQDNGRIVAKALKEVGYDPESTFVDASDRASVDALAEKTANLGSVTHVVHTPACLPLNRPRRQSSKLISLVPRTSSKLSVMLWHRGSGVVISSQAGHMSPPLPAEQNEDLNVLRHPNWIDWNACSRTSSPILGSRVQWPNELTRCAFRRPVLNGAIAEVVLTLWARGSS